MRQTQEATFDLPGLPVNVNEPGDELLAAANSVYTTGYTNEEKALEDLASAAAFQEKQDEKKAKITRAARSRYGFAPPGAGGDPDFPESGEPVIIDNRPAPIRIVNSRKILTREQQQEVAGWEAAVAAEIAEERRQAEIEGWRRFLEDNPGSIG